MPEPSPYAPPKASVRDVAPDATSFRIRTKWVYLCGLLGMAVLCLVIKDLLWEALTLRPLIAALALTALLSVSPLRALAVRRDGVSPVWWDAMLYCTVGLFLYGTFAEDPEPMLVGLLPLVAVSALLSLGTWIVEIRHSVRVYSTARAFHFVDDK